MCASNLLCSPHYDWNVSSVVYSAYTPLVSAGHLVANELPTVAHTEALKSRITYLLGTSIGTPRTHNF